MTDAEVTHALRPHGCGVEAEPLRGPDAPELTTRQTAWLELKAEQGWPQIGPCRWVGECLVVEVRGMFGPETFVIDPEGNEL